MKLTRANLNGLIFPFVLLGFYVLYYSTREQVDFAVFWTAGNNWNLARNPYEVINQSNPGHPYVNAPSGLFLFSLFARFDLELAGVIFRIISVGLGLVLCYFIERKYSIPVLLTLPFMIFSVPFRVTVGSGQVGLIVCFSFFLLFIMELKSKTFDLLIKILLGVIVLSLKPYMFIGYFVYLLLKRCHLQLILTTLTFLLLNILISPNLFLIREWILNLRDVGGDTFVEANNSSIIALMNRSTGNLALGLLFYAAFNFFLVYKLWRNIGSSKYSIFYTAILGIELSPYIHHQDYLLPLFAFLIVSSDWEPRMLRILSIWTGVGLQLNSFFIQLIIEFYRNFVYWRERTLPYSIIFLLIGSVSAVLWSQGQLDWAFLVYDTNYQIWVFFLVVLQNISFKSSENSQKST